MLKNRLSSRIIRVLSVALTTGLCSVFVFNAAQTVAQTPTLIVEKALNFGAFYPASDRRTLYQLKPKPTPEIRELTSNGKNAALAEQIELQAGLLRLRWAKPNTSYQLTLPQSGTRLPLTSGENTLYVRLNHRAMFSKEVLTNTDFPTITTTDDVSDSGKTEQVSFYVGARVIIPPNQPSGLYTGTLSIELREAGQTLDTPIASLPVEARIFGSISGIVRRDIDFGKIVLASRSTAAANDITLNPQGQRTRTGAMLLKGTPQSGLIVFYGTPNTAFTLSNSSATLRNENNENEEINYTFHPDTDSASITTSSGAVHRLDSNGVTEVKLGGKITISADQKAGKYVGNMLLQFNY